MRLLSRALRAAQCCRAAALPHQSRRAAPGRSGAVRTCLLLPRCGLTARPGLRELLDGPALRRLLEARGADAVGPELAARVRRLRDKEQELCETRELARQEPAEEDSAIKTRFRASAK